MEAKGEKTITNDLFTQWANEIFFPRARLQEDGHGILMPGGCSAKIPDAIEEAWVWHDHHFAAREIIDSNTGDVSCHRRGNNGTWT
jgi:hypothetical protein